MPDWLSTSVISNGLTPGTMLVCTLASLVLGLGVATSYMFKNTWSKGFAVTLVLLPAIVQMIIMMVNGNVGTGVAVAGAFSLVRFRSAPGTARDITVIFLSMAVGLATGMGYLFYALLLLLFVGVASMALTVSPFGEKRGEHRTLHITIPETLDYDALFEDVLSQYTRGARLDRVRTTNMGSLFELTYDVELRSGVNTKAFLDDLRCRNGNLNISLSRAMPDRDAL